MSGGGFGRLHHLTAGRGFERDAYAILLEGVIWRQNSYN